MTQKVFKGEIKGRIVEVRFALSGKTERVLKKTGDYVKKGELLAALEKKIFQTELDRQLADYEKVRADFEIFNLQKGGAADDLTKYLKMEKQAQLNASVKEVELAKARLDQTDLFSPVEGVILDDSNLAPGMYITPASYSFKILETGSLWFEVEITQEDISFFSQPRSGEVEIFGVGKQPVTTGQVLA
ncbi:MAG: efflux RND transporter periplasmic adaptor subunit, partial [Microgenomates group bacterium]